MPAPLNANELHLSTPALPATRPSQEEMPLMLAVAYANVLWWMYIFAFVQPYQFDPELDPEEEAPEEALPLLI